MRGIAQTDFSSLPGELFGQCPLGRLEKTRAWIESQGKKTGSCIEIWGEEIESSWRELKNKYRISATGAVNGWLLLVGPSKGNPPPRGEDLTPWKYQLYVGSPHPGFLMMKDKPFWNRVRKLVESFSREFDLSLEDGLSLMHHANLSSMKSSTQPDRAYLEPGAPGILEVRERTQARCIIGYTKDVYEILEREAQRRYGRPTKSGDFSWQGLKPRPWSVWRPGRGPTFMVVRLGNHPSRPGNIVRWSSDIGRRAKKELDC